MKLLILTDNYWPRVGGAETYALELAVGMAFRGHEVTVYTDGDRRQPGLQIKWESGVRVIRDSSFWPRLSIEGATWENLTFGRLPELSKVLSRERFDIIHANNHDTAFLGALAKLDQDSPLVVTSHEVGRQEGPLGVARLRFVMEVLPVDLILSMSNYYADEARRYGTCKVERVYLGVNTGKFHPSRAKHDGTNLKVMCLARFKPRKGLDTLIHAAAIVLRDHPNTEFIVAGSASSASPDYLHSLRATIEKLGISRNFHIREDLTLDMVPDQLRSAQIAVQPSYSEGLGLAALEALSTELPVVASRTTGLTEFIKDGENGLLVTPGNIPELATAISRLAANQTLRRKLGAEGRKTVLDSFSSQNMLRQTESLYEDLISKRISA